MFKLKKTMLHANREREKYQFEIALSTLSGLAGLGERCERGPVLIQLTRGPKVLRSAVVDVKNGNATWTSDALQALLLLVSQSRLHSTNAATTPRSL